MTADDDEDGFDDEEAAISQRRKFMKLPMNRIRQIINLDPDSIMFNKESLVVTSKATEAFIQDLGGVCAQIAKTQKRKTLLL